MVLEKICRTKKRTKELSTDLSDGNALNEQTPLNNPVIDNEYIGGIGRKKRMLECLCTIEAEQREKTSLFIDGYEQTVVISIEDAVIPLEPLIPDIHEKIQIAKEERNRVALEDLNELDLTQDESIAIRLYTMQWNNSENSLYWLLNNSLRTAKDREQMEPWFGYLKLVLMGLMKLPSENRTIWRGVQLDLSGNFEEGQDIIWWAFTSCTEKNKLLQNDFLGQVGRRTLFCIEPCRGKSIKNFSDYANESEILLLPGTKLRVISILPQGSDLHIIHLQEVVPQEPLLRIPLSPQEIQNERVQHRREPNDQTFRLVPIEPAKPIWQKYPSITVGVLIVFLLSIVIITCVVLVKNGIFTKTKRLPQVHGNRTAVCHLHGDPHILVFPETPSEVRSQYWCKMPGENLVLRNKYVQIKAHVTEKFWYNERFEIILYGYSGENICTVTDQQQNCESPNISMLQLNQGKWIDIIYKIIGMRIQIRRRSNSPFYDISIHLPFNLIYVSEGVCISPHEQCEPESVGTDSQEDVTIKDTDRKVCNLYLEGAINVTQQLKIPYQPEMINHLRVSCLHDFITTNDTTVGTSSLFVLVAEGINALNTTDEEFTMITNQSVAIIGKTIEAIDTQTKQDSKVVNTIRCYTCGNRSCTTDWLRYPERREHQYGDLCFVEVKYDYMAGAQKSYRYLKHVKAGAQTGTGCHPFNTKDYYWYCCNSHQCNEQWIVQWLSLN